MFVMDVTDRAWGCLKSVFRLGVDKDHRTLILCQTCITNEMNRRQELKMVYSGDLNDELDKLMSEVYQINLETNGKDGTLVCENMDV